MLLKLLPVHFCNAPHKHNLTSDALNNHVGTVVKFKLVLKTMAGVNLTAM